MFRKCSMGARCPRLMWIIYALSLFVSTAVGPGLAPADADQAPARSFYMGISPWPYDLTQAAVDWTNEAIRAHGDAVEQHFEEGVPWPEALTNSPYQPGLADNIRYRVRQMAGRKRVVSINCLDMSRHGLAPYRGNSPNMPLQPPWTTYRLNDPAVKTAYLNYAEHIIDTMKPDYLLIGVEVNILLRDRPDLWPDYLDLHRSTYTALKARHPNLPIMVSVFCVPYFAGQSTPDEPDLQRRELKKLLPFTDIVGFSVHPFMSSLLAESVPAGYFDDLFSLAGGKPIAITESSYPAEEWSIPVNGTRLTFRGSPQKQNAFVTQMLTAVQKHRLQFACWFAMRDYDPLWEKLGKTDTLLVWRDTGLFDENGQPRPALTTWDLWLDRPYDRDTGHKP
jgi:hypothetical protein